MKLSSANNSFKLFCNGVPVINSLPLEMNDLTICERIESTFLIRCASSITIYSKLNFFNADFSMRQISYEVMQTSKSCVMRRVAIRSARSSFEPERTTVLTSGVHWLNSRAQFWRVDLGTTMRWGPAVFAWCFRYARKEMV